MSEAKRFRLSGDEGVGLFEPTDIRPPNFTRLPNRTLNQLRTVNGLVSTASDVLDETGWRTTVSAAVLIPRHVSSTNVVGHALTLRYLPSRRDILQEGRDALPPKLAHHVIFRLATKGDVMIIDASGARGISTMGGIAAHTAYRHGLAGAIVDGGVRDLEEIISSGLPLWSRWVTPISGKPRLEAVSVNGPVSCGGVQVIAGDLVLADRTGICFVPPDVAEQVVGRIVEVSSQERGEFRSESRTS